MLWRTKSEVKSLIFRLKPGQDFLYFRLFIGPESQIVGYNFAAFAVRVDE
jgi:hypothetical protein